MIDNLTIIGKLTVCLKGPNGEIREREVVDNLVVTVGKNHVADQLSSQAEVAMSNMAIGTGTAAQLLTDTSLEVELNRKAFTSKAQGSGGNANQVMYITEWPSGEGTGAISEAGIFNAASSGVMLCRTTFDVKNKGAGDSITLTWTITVN